MTWILVVPAVLVLLGFDLLALALCRAAKHGDTFHPAQRHDGTWWN